MYMMRTNYHCGSFTFFDVQKFQYLTNKTNGYNIHYITGHNYAT